jgi:hypothetical protein
LQFVLWEEWSRVSILRLTRHPVLPDSAVILRPTLLLSAIFGFYRLRLRDRADSGRAAFTLNKLGASFNDFFAGGFGPRSLGDVGSGDVFTFFAERVIHAILSFRLAVE